MESDEKKTKEEIVLKDTDQAFPQVTTLFEWTAAGRPFKKRQKKFYVNAMLIVFLLEIILFFFHEYMLMAVLLAFLFVTFALNTVPPRNFCYKITNGGMTIEDHFFLWQELYDFYFKKRFDHIEVLHIRTRAFLPGEITLTIHDTDKEKIKMTLLHFLPYREIITPTFTEKSADWLTKTFPLEEKTHKVAAKV